MELAQCNLHQRGISTCLTNYTQTWPPGFSTATAGFELGTTDYSRSTVRILDIGGMIWESERSYTSVAAALADAEQALAAWLADNGLPVVRTPGV